MKKAEGRHGYEGRRTGMSEDDENLSAPTDEVNGRGPLLWNLVYTPLGVSPDQAARVRAWFAERARAALRGDPPPVRPCVDCGFGTVPEELLCRTCWERRQRAKLGDRRPS